MLYRWLPIINQISQGILLSIGLYIGIYGQSWSLFLAVLVLFVLITSGTTVHKSQDSAWMNFIWKFRTVPIGIVFFGILFSFWLVNLPTSGFWYVIAALFGNESFINAFYSLTSTRC